MSASPLTLNGIATKISIPSGGGLNSYLVNLENAQFVAGYRSSPENTNGKTITYKILDQFLKFYLYFVKPNIKLILLATTPQIAFNTSTKGRLGIYLGLAFENYCNVNAMFLASRLGI